MKYGDYHPCVSDCVITIFIDDDNANSDFVCVHFSPMDTCSMQISCLTCIYDMIISLNDFLDFSTQETCAYKSLNWNFASSPPSGFYLFFSHSIDLQLCHSEKLRRL